VLQDLHTDFENKSPESKSPENKHSKCDAKKDFSLHLPEIEKDIDTYYDNKESIYKDVYESTDQYRTRLSEKIDIAKEFTDMVVKRM